MSEIVDKLVAEGRLNNEQVERIGRRVRDFVKAAQEDPELMKEAQEKLAFPALGGGGGGMGSMVAKNLLGAGALTFGSAMGLKGYNVVAGKLQGIKDDKLKAKHYKDMIDVNPELGEKGVDATLMQRHFNTLYKFNPDYAKDPMVAGAYIEQTMESAKPSIGILNELVRARGEHVRAQQGQKEIPQAAGQLMSHMGKLTENVGSMRQSLDTEMKRLKDARGGGHQ